MPVPSQLAATALVVQYVNSPEFTAMLRMPKEIILRIAEGLSLVDLIHFASVCKDIYNIIIEDSYLLTKHMLQTHSFTFTRSLFSRNEFRWLLSREYGVRWLDHVRMSQISWPQPSRKFALNNGFLAAISLPIPVLQPTCVVQTVYAPDLMDTPNALPFAWTTAIPSRFPIEVAIAPELDLLAVLCANFDNVVVVLDDDEVDQDMTIELHLCQLSSTGPHPCAAEPMYTFNIPVHAATPLGQLSARVCICGDLIFFHIGNAHDPMSTVMIVANWRTGMATKIIFDVPYGLFGLTVLTYNRLAVTTDRPSVDIYNIVDSKPTLLLIASLQMPALRPLQQTDLLNIVSPPLTNVRVEGVPSFWDSPRSQAHGCVYPSTHADGGVFVLTLNTSGVPMRRENTYNFVYSIAKLLRIADLVYLEETIQPTNIITWDGGNMSICPPELVIPHMLWGPSTGRAMRSLDAHDYSFGVAGHKIIHYYSTTSPRVTDVVGGTPVVASSALDPIVITDFTPETAPARDEDAPVDSYSAWNAQGTGEWEPVDGKDCHVRLVSGATVIPAAHHEQRVFAEDVVGTLPYREVVTAPVEQVTYAMLDDARYWLLRSRPAEDEGVLQVFSL